MVKDNLFNGEIRRKIMGIDESHAIVTKNMGRSRSRGPKRRNKFKKKKTQKKERLLAITIRKKVI